MTITTEKNLRRKYFSSGSTVMKSKLTLKHGFHTNKRLFELCGTENDFTKYFAKCPNLFKYFVSDITATAPNDTLLYYKNVVHNFSEILFWYQSKSNIKCLNG